MKARTQATATRLAVLLALLLASTAPAPAAKKSAPVPDHWVGTWAAAPFAYDNRDGRIGAADATYRQTVHLSLGGALLRVELSNEFGTEPLAIASVHAALSAGPGGEIALASANALTFHGSPAVVIPAGGAVVSDPFSLTAPKAANLTVSLFLPAQRISHVSYHGSANASGYRVAGNLVGERTLAGPATPDAGPVETLHSWYFLKGVDVQEPAEDGAVVAFGDSITDGAHATTDANTRWPDVLARRLAGDKKTRSLGVLNEGIGGNRLLEDGTGPNALARFDRDVLARPGVRYLIVLEGINDLGHGPDPVNVVTGLSGMPPTAGTPGTQADLAQNLINALAELTERAHAHGITVYLATLTPFAGASYATPEGETTRTTVNAWIRGNKVADGFIDFDHATRDPAHPDTFLPKDDSGDHLHPNDAGYKAMGEAISLKLFYPKNKDVGPE